MCNELVQPLRGGDKEEECWNCAALGLRNVDGRLVVPCTNCAIDNDFTWDGLENFCPSLRLNSSKGR